MAPEVADEVVRSRQPEVWHASHPVAHEFMSRFEDAYVPHHRDLVSLTGSGGYVGGLGEAQGDRLLQQQMHPQVLLLDEPIGALDAQLRKQMQQELKRIQREVGITFLYVTHDQDEAMTMSDRLAVMRDGRVEDIGTPGRVYNQPATEFVASFLGASNLIDARVAEAGHDMAELTSVDGMRLLVTRERLGSRVAADKVKIGIRPEKIRLTPLEEEPSASANSVIVTIRTAAFTGVSSQYSVISQTGPELTVYAQNTGQALTFKPSDVVRLQWRPQDAFIVPASPPPADDEPTYGQ